MEEMIASVKLLKTLLLAVFVGNIYLVGTRHGFQYGRAEAADADARKAFRRRAFVVLISIAIFLYVVELGGVVFQNQQSVFD